VPLRGVEPAAFKVHTGIKIVEGRNFEPGRNEIIVGRAATRQFVGLDLGSSVKWGENVWQVVGVFEAGGSAAESEIWCDAKVLQPAYRRGNSYQSVYARLATPDSFDTLKDALTTDPQLNVMVMREPEYYERQSTVMQTIIRTVGFTIAILMGLGAIFAAVNTMYNAVASRSREIATLRALGFGGIPVVLSVLTEAVVLSVIGGIIGGLLAWAAFDGYQTSTMNFQSFSQVAFAFAVTPSLLIRGLMYSVVMGILGGMFPAIRAARLPIVSALRQL
jgi:putative ABC transport system permease protein